MSCVVLALPSSGFAAVSANRDSADALPEIYADVLDTTPVARGQAAPTQEGVRSSIVNVDAIDEPFPIRLGRGLFALVVMIGVLWGFSANRSAIRWSLVAKGLGLQMLFALLILKTDWGRGFFRIVNDVFVALLGYTNAGASFVFGNLAKPVVPVSGGAGTVPLLANFAFSVLPTIIFFSALMTILYYLGLMQRVVTGVAWLMQRTLGTSGAETTSVAGNIFVGQIEAPLLVKPFIETGQPETAETLHMELEQDHSNVIDAAAGGAADGMRLALNVGAMLIAFLALIALFNGLLGWGLGLFGIEGVTLEMVLGYAFAPVAWLIGVPISDAAQIGSLFGVKMVANEFVAFQMLAEGLAAGSSLSPKSVIIATYALTGFANFSSIAIQIGGIGGIAPSRRQDLSKLGMRAMLGGTTATWMTATFAGVLA